MKLIRNKIVFTNVLEETFSQLKKHSNMNTSCLIFSTKLLKVPSGFYMYYLELGLLIDIRH